MPESNKRRARSTATAFFFGGLAVVSWAAADTVSTAVGGAVFGAGLLFYSLICFIEAM